MTASDGDFEALDPQALLAFAERRACELGVPLHKDRLREVADNLGLLQGHARIVGSALKGETCP